MSKEQAPFPAEKELFLGFSVCIYDQALFFAAQNRMPSVMLAQE